MNRARFRVIRAVRVIRVESVDVSLAADQRLRALGLELELLPLRDHRCGPTVQPLGVLRFQVDTAVSARPAEVVAPVRAVQGNATLGDVHYPRAAGQVEAAGASYLRAASRSSAQNARHVTYCYMKLSDIRSHESHVLSTAIA